MRYELFKQSMISCDSHPLQIPRLKKHQPVPSTTYQEPREQDVMAEIREKNRRKAEVCHYLTPNVCAKVETTGHVCCFVVFYFNACQLKTRKLLIVMNCIYPNL